MTSTTAPAFTHTVACTDQAVGRAVRLLRDAVITDVPMSVDLLDVLNTVRDSGLESQRPETCDCAKTELHRIETALPNLRKRERAYRNSPAFGSAAYSAIAAEIDDLVARRAAIRAELAR